MRSPLNTTGSAAIVQNLTKTIARQRSESSSNFKVAHLFDMQDQSTYLYTFRDPGEWCQKLIQLQKPYQGKLHSLQRIPTPPLINENPASIWSPVLFVLPGIISGNLGSWVVATSNHTIHAYIWWCLHIISMYIYIYTVYTYAYSYTKIHHLYESMYT